MNSHVSVSPSKEMVPPDLIGSRWSSGSDNRISNVKQFKFETFPQSAASAD